jgi:hypothetical protein
MKRKILISFLLTFCLFALVSASNIDGKWKGSMQGPDGDMEMLFVFNVINTDSLAGTVQSPMGEIEIINGNVKGDVFSFDVQINDMIIHHQCKVLGDSISMKVPGMQRGDMELVLKAVKNEK